MSLMVQLEAQSERDLAYLMSAGFIQKVKSRSGGKIFCLDIYKDCIVYFGLLV